MIKAIEKIINDNQYTIMQLPARQNLLFIAKWTKHLKPIAHLLSTMSEKSNLLDLDLDVGVLIESICDNIEPKILSDLIFESFKNVSVLFTDDNGSKKAIKLGEGANFDMFFANNMIDMFLVLWEILKVNVFGDNTDFFSKLTIVQEKKAENTNK